ncbi:MAG TPA: hypothetical protein VKU19_29145 [Bryobacteraceae bacterium]|nr:hypothetical protein [Bryobacteraceae bacterium]
MSSSATRSPLRQLLENRISQLSTEVEGLFVDARERSRREYADQLNQIVRRICQSDSTETLGATLLDGARSFATVAALFDIDGDMAKGRQICGVLEDAAEAFRSLEIPLSYAAALAGAVETRDPVVTVTTPGEVSADLMSVVGHTGDGRASIFPLVVRERVIALLYAWGAVQGSTLEMLTQVASSVWSVLSRPAPVELLQIAPAPLAAATEPEPQVEPEREEKSEPQPASEPASAWERLGPEEQQIHLRAQRFARVQVAEMRLYNADAVQAGRSRRDIYDALRKPIDASRQKFRETYFSACASMVDYLHLEIVRILANDDPEILGKYYPGSLV